jgi:hypothetical protein
MGEAVIPNPDPTSRFPTAYCKTCGGGWPEYVRCEKWEWSNATLKLKTQCDFSGEVPMSPEMQAVRDAFDRGEVPAGTRKLAGKSEWTVPSVKQTVDPNSIPGWGVPTKGK